MSNDTILPSGQIHLPGPPRGGRRRRRRRSAKGPLARLITFGFRLLILGGIVKIIAPIALTLIVFTFGPSVLSSYLPGSDSIVETASSFDGASFAKRAIGTLKSLINIAR